MVRTGMMATTLLVLAQAASAASFVDNFEGGSLSSTNWLHIGNGQIVVDPLNSSNHALSFSALAKGGDIITVPLDLSGPQITLSFDYLGIDGTTGVGTDTGGFIIVYQPVVNSGAVLMGTSSTGGPLLPDMLNLTPGVWNHISVTFPSTLVAGKVGSRFTFEEWGSSPNTPGNAFFDNIQINATPEPGTAALLSGGLLAGGLVLCRRRPRPSGQRP